MKKIKSILLILLAFILLFCFSGCKHEETAAERTERLHRELEEAQRKNKEAKDAFNSLYNDITIIENYQNNH